MPDSIAGLAPVPQQSIQGNVDAAMSALGGMDSEGFLNLLVAQLRYQSPMDPKDPGDLMTQTAALAQLDATQQLLALQQRDLGMQQAVAAAGMLGTEVTAIGADGVSIEGRVDAVRYTTAGPVLEIGGQDVMLDDVRELRADAPGAAQTTSPSPTTTPTTSTPITPTTDA